MTRTKIFFDQPKPKKAAIRTIRGYAHELNEVLSNRHVESSEGTGIRTHPYGRSSGSNN